MNLNKIDHFEERKIGDWFQLLPPGKIDGNKQNTNPGQYYLISTGQQNNGILKMVDQWEYDGENNQYITVAMYGSSGSCFIQNRKFIVNHNVRVLQPKNPISQQDLHIWAMMLNKILPKKYNYSNGVSIQKLLEEVIPYPIFQQ